MVLKAKGGYLKRIRVSNFHCILCMGGHVTMSKKMSIMEAASKFGDESKAEE